MGKGQLLLLKTIKIMISELTAILYEKTTRSNSQNMVFRHYCPSIVLMILLCLPFIGHTNTDPTTVIMEDRTDFCEAAINVDSWLTGTPVGSNQLNTFFNVTNAEFIEFTEQNNIESIRIEYFWRNNAGNLIESVATVEIDTLGSSFSAENWSYTISPADLINGEYLASVYLNGVDCGQQILIPIVIDDYEEPEEPLVVELPEFNCGELYEYEPVTNQNPLTDAHVGELFTIGGFPILLETIDGSNGTFSGTGIIPLPFSRSVTQVTFNSVSVNTDRVIYEGSVQAIPGDPSDYPDFLLNTDPLNIGDDICLPPPPPPGTGPGGIDPVTGLDPWGFDPTTGVHSETDTTYDQNGFFPDGTHKDTNTEFNECGCSREGLDADQQPCDPGCGPNPEAEEFAESIRTTLPTTIEDLLNVLDDEFESQIAELNCAGIRSEMNGLVTAENRNFYFGESDIYFKIDMHLAFTERPSISNNNYDRTPASETLETRHVDLYDCDKKEYAFNKYRVAIADLLLDNQDLLDQILADIANWTETEYELYSDSPEEFEAWLLRQLGKEIKAQSGLDDSYTYQSNETSDNPYDIEKRVENLFNIDPHAYYHTTASINAEPSHKQNLSKAELSEAAFTFQQGDRYIKGVHRAYYLEEMARQQMMMPPPSTGSLPVKIEKTVGNVTYTIYLDNLVFNPDGASLNSYLIITDQESGRRIVFEGENIGFGPTGLQGNSRLSLASDVEVRLSNVAMLILKGTGDTYVDWDCEGFSSMGIDAQVEFCRDHIIPLDESTLEPLPDTARYRLDVSVQDMSAWLEFSLEIDAPPFAVAQYPDVKWEMDQMVLDFSSNDTPQFTPMEGYDSPFWNDLTSTMSPGWRGFYMHELSATFPNDFSNSSEPIRASATDILIDGSGFTGGVGVENLIDIGTGNLSGWAFSIDEFNLSILKNQFNGAGMSGQLNVPIFEENMEYEASIFAGSRYEFVVSPETDLTANLFLATATIYEESHISVSYEPDTGFVAVATLNGHLNVGGAGENESGHIFDFPSICFEGFKVSNQAPYFTPGIWGVDSLSVGLSFNGFGVRMDRISPFDPGPGLAGVGFELAVKLSDSEGLNVNAKGGLNIIGELYDNNGRQKWRYKETNLTSLAIAGNIPGLGSIAGGVEWYDADQEPDQETDQEPEYGEGFRGFLDITVKNFGMRLTAIAQFGKLTPPGESEFKYFYVDALMKFGDVAPTIGIITLKGFGGGVSNNMRIEQSETLMLYDSDAPFEMPDIGVSLSNTRYVPDRSRSISLKASLVIAVVKEEVFNGTVGLSVEFNDGGSLAQMILTGSGQFITPVDFGIASDFLDGTSNETLTKPATTNAALSAYIFLALNFNENSFHGTFDAFLNVGGILTGGGPDGHVVNSVMHFDPESWYVYIGTPTMPCTIAVTLPLVGRVAGVSAYFDIGTDVPSMPPLPRNVQELAPLVNTNESFRQSGEGLVFGAALDFKLEADAGIISGIVEAGAGFDVMIKKYNGLHCEGSNEPVGINGWYALGQIYAYLNAEIKFAGIKILGAGMAAVLQARLPNPFWAQATLGVKIEIPVLPDVHLNIKMELGDDCLLVSDNPQDQLGIKVISYLKPFTGAADVETSVVPEAVFAMEMDREYVVPDFNDPNINYTFIARLQEVQLLSSDGSIIPFSHEWSDDKTTLVANPLNFLPGSDSITFRVAVDVYMDGELIAEEVNEVYFHTDELIDYIPLENISSAYPVNGMSNFYKDDAPSGLGFIILEAGQPDLFLDVPDGYQQIIRLTDSQGNSQVIDFNYDLYDNKISFPLSGDILVNEEFYKLQLVQVPSSSVNQSSSGLVFDVVDIAFGPSLPSEPRSNRASDQSSNGEAEHTIYTSYFRTSRYNTLRDKLGAINDRPIGNGWKVEIAQLELFDAIELFGSGDSDPILNYTVTATGYSANQAIDILEDLTDLARRIEDEVTYVQDRLDRDLDEYVSVNLVRFNKAVRSNDMIVTSREFEVGTMDRNYNQYTNVDSGFRFSSAIRIMVDNLRNTLVHRCTNHPRLESNLCSRFNRDLDDIPLLFHTDIIHANMHITYKIPEGHQSTGIIDYVND